MPGLWSYDPADLASNEKDAIRLEIGDTDSQNWLLADQEITYAISQERNFWAAAARCAEMAGRAILRKADVRLGRSLQVQYAKAAQQYFDMARRLRCKAMGTVAPWVGGMSVSDKVAYTESTDLVAPLFTKTMQENPWVGGYETDSGAPIGEGEATTEEDELL